MQYCKEHILKMNIIYHHLGQEIQFIREATEIKPHSNMNKKDRLSLSGSQEPINHSLKDWKKKVLSNNKMVIFSQRKSSVFSKNHISLLPISCAHGPSKDYFFLTIPFPSCNKNTVAPTRASLKPAYATHTSSTLLTLTLKMEVACSSEMLLSTYRT
jgi:hypothetical protein